MIEFVRGFQSRAGLLVGAACCALGCAASPPPYVVRYADVGHGGLSAYQGDRALVVEFQAGDRLPVDLQFDGEDFVLERKDAELTLVARQHCFVRFGEGGIRVSLDGKTFDQKPRVPGSFMIGLHATRTEAPSLQVHVKGPRR